MHNNYYFLRQLSLQLHKRLKHNVLLACFTQNKDECILEFYNGTDTVYLVANLQAEFCALNVVPSFQRAKKNTRTIFDEIVGHTVSEVRQFENDRSFSIRFEHEWECVFKMHGQQANLWLCKEDRVVKIFRNHLKKDLMVAPSALSRSIDFSFDHVPSSLEQVSKTFQTWGKPVIQYLRDQSYENKSIEERKVMLEHTKKLLEHPQYYLCNDRGTPALRLWPCVGGQLLHNPIEALRSLNAAFWKQTSFQKLQSQLLKCVHAEFTKLRATVQKIEKDLAALKTTTSYQYYGDIIMARLEAVKPGMDSVMLLDFDESKKVLVKLQKSLNAQQNAARYYKKAKKQHKEIAHLEQILQQKSKRFQQAKEAIILIEDAKTLKDLDGHVTWLPNKSSTQNVPSVPYREVVYQNYKIWIGKGAAQNDILTTKLAHKEDIWLHVRDVSGSHVIIKKQSGKTVPKEVIERAAQLAAFYSKRKNETLCPVMVTQKKYVFKRKNALPGMVRVEREKTIMVQPIPAN